MVILRLNIVTWFPDEEPGFEIYRALVDLEQPFKDSVLKLDYNCTPWPRFDGNLLW